MSDRIPGELAGLTAVVTGSSGGIGRAIALGLAAAGAHCLVHGNTNLQAAEGAAADIRSHGVDSRAILCDLAHPGAAESFVHDAWTWRGGVDVWVNNAGADVLTGAARDWGFEKKLTTLLQLDVAATAQLSRAAGARMKERGVGTIINIGWDQAPQGMAGDSGQLFAAAKGAVMAFTNSLARSLAPQVRVNCVAPGWIKTRWGEDASQYWQDRARGESLLDRWGTPEDVAAVVRFLASPAAAFVNAQTISVNGGLKPS